MWSIIHKKKKNQFMRLKKTLFFFLVLTSLDAVWPWEEVVSSVEISFWANQNRLNLWNALCSELQSDNSFLCCTKVFILKIEWYNFLDLFLKFFYIRFLSFELGSMSVQFYQFWYQTRDDDDGHKFAIWSASTHEQCYQQDA